MCQEMVLNTSVDSVIQVCTQLHMTAAATSTLQHTNQLLSSAPKGGGILFILHLLFVSYFFFQKGRQKAQKQPMHRIHAQKQSMQKISLI